MSAFVVLVAQWGEALALVGIALALACRLCSAAGESGREAELRLTREGTVEELAAYLETLRSRLERAARRWLGRRRDEAADAVQETYIRLLQADADDLRRFTGASRLDSYVHQIVRNVVVDWLRRERQTETLPQDYEETPSDSAGPAAEAERQDMQRLVRAAIASLPRRLRQTLTMFYLMDLNCAEIAEALGISENRVTGLLCEGRKALAPKLQAQADPR